MMSFTSIYWWYFLGRPRSLRTWTVFLLLLVVVMSFGLSWFLITQSQTHTSSPFDKFPGGAKCRSLFTIINTETGLGSRDPEAAGRVTPLQHIIHSYTQKIINPISQSIFGVTTQVKKNINGLQETVEALRKAREGPSGTNVELYLILADYLPSLLHPREEGQHTFNHTVVDTGGDANIITTEYSGNVLNSHKGPAPEYKLMRELPKSPYPFSPRADRPRPPHPYIGNVMYDVLPFSRLQLTEGHLPYLPCKVRLYTEEDVRQCLQRREARGSSLWLAFVGDSRLRVRFQHFLERTSHLNWNITLNNQNSTIEWRDYVMKNPRPIQESMEAVSSQGGPRASLVWAIEGLMTNNPTPGPLVPTPLLREWARGNTPIPHVIFLGFGIWMMLKSKYTLFGLTELVTSWKEMRQVLVGLTSRTTVILLPQTRYRPHTLQDFVEEQKHFIKLWQLVTYTYPLMERNVDWADRVMLHFAKDTGAVILDSSLPLNVAAVSECGLLKEAQQDKHPGYLHHLNCGDTHHASPATMYDEITIIFKYLCNAELPPIHSNHNHCC